MARYIVARKVKTEDGEAIISVETYGIFGKSKMNLKQARRIKGFHHERGYTDYVIFKLKEVE